MSTPDIDEFKEKAKTIDVLKVEKAPVKQKRATKKPK